MREADAEVLGGASEGMEEAVVEVVEREEEASEADVLGVEAVVTSEAVVLVVVALSVAGVDMVGWLYEAFRMFAVPAAMEWDDASSR